MIANDKSATTAFCQKYLSFMEPLNDLCNIAGFLSLSSLRINVLNNIDSHSV